VTRRHILHLPAVRPFDGSQDRRVESGELVARAHTDWVFLDSATLRPAPIPRELRVAFFPERLPEPAPRRSRFHQRRHLRPASFGCSGGSNGEILTRSNT
jgi:hypothetical protein